MAALTHVLQIPNLACNPFKKCCWCYRNIVCLLLFADECYLQSGLVKQRVEETESGSRLPLNKQGKKGRMSASGNHKTGQGRLVSSILFLNSLIHAATPPPFWFIQGNSISILDPSLALPINSSLPCVDP